MTDAVRVDVADGVAVVTIDRPEAMNAMNRAVRVGLAAAFRRLDADAAVRAIVLTGRGERAFSAGLDLKELAADPAAMADTVATDGETNPGLAIERCAKPVVGAVNGVAITGGFELALACDFLVASEHARFADTHARVGILPGWGLSQKLGRIVGIGRAKELHFTGNFIDADTAERWGLVNRVVPADRLLPVAIGLARDMAGIEPDFLAAYKRLVDEGHRLALGEGLALEGERALAANAGVTPEAVAARREAVQARGRTQRGG